MIRKVVISTAWHPVCVGTYLRRGFEALGHTVVAVGPTSGQVQPWPGCEGKLYPAADVALTWPPGNTMQPAVLAALEELTDGASLWVDIDGGYRVPICARQWPGLKRVYVNTDPHVTGLGLSPSSPRLSEWDMSYMMQLMPGRGGWLPYAADREWFQPEIAATAPPDLLVSVPGAIYPEREDLAVELAGHLGFGKVGGPGIGGIYAEHAAWLRRAKVVVVWPLSTDLPCRVFEALACGRPVVVRESVSLCAMQVNGLLPPAGIRVVSRQREVLPAVRELLHEFWTPEGVHVQPSFLPAGNFWEDRAQQIIERRQLP